MARILKYLNEKGEVEEKEITEVERPKIISTVSDDTLLKRISKVYDEIKDVIAESSEPKINNLEAFEILFMRTNIPEALVKTWEKIIWTYKEALKLFNGEIENKKIIYSIVLFNYLKILTEEEKEREDIKRIIEIYNSYEGEIK